MKYLVILGVFISGLAAGAALSGYDPSARPTSTAASRPAMSEPVKVAAADCQAEREHAAMLEGRLAEIREQLTEHSAHSTENSGEQELLNGIGSILGLPPAATKLATQATAEFAGTIQANIARSNKAMQDARAMGQLRVIQTLMQSCGTRDNGDCVLHRMCESKQADPEMRIEADSCGDSVDCWRKVLNECETAK